MHGVTMETVDGFGG